MNLIILILPDRVASFRHAIASSIYRLVISSRYDDLIPEAEVALNGQVSVVCIIKYKAFYNGKSCKKISEEVVNLLVNKFYRLIRGKSKANIFAITILSWVIIL